MAKTRIEWASHTWNPYTWNCTKVSPGCKNCYAAAMADRFGRNYAGAGFLKHAPVWDEVKAAKLDKLPKGAVIFVNSMSDTWHEGVSVDVVKRIHQAAADHPDKTFLLLTKRPERALEHAGEMEWYSNLWMGTSVESRQYLHRLDTLLQIPAAGHFVSMEPMLGAIHDDEIAPYLKPQGNRAGLGWVIVGGESGDKRRPFDKAWALVIQMACYEAGVPFMFKQGSHRVSGRDRMLNGRTWDQSPFVDDVPVVREPVQMDLFGGDDDIQAG